MDYIVEARNIEKSFSGHQALSNVSFAIPKGKIFGLLGPNGAGKTSFIRCLNGILIPDAGELIFNGGQTSNDTLCKIGYLPEERGLYKKMKVQDQLMYLAQLKGLSKSKAQSNTQYWLEKFDIGSWKNKKIEELSKGMAQKIQFIATVIHDPDLLILDEPFSGFDPINTEIIKNEIIEQQQKGVSIILSTHNMNSVEELCDYIVLLNKGKVLLNGEISAVKLKHSKKEFEIIFDGNMISFTTALWTGFELISKEKLENKRLKVVVSSTSNTGINELLKAVLPSCKIWSVHEKIPSMHQIFINQINKAAQVNTTEELQNHD